MTGSVNGNMFKFVWGRDIVEEAEDISWTQRQWNKLPVIKYFAVIGVLECTGSTLGFISQPHIDGPLYSIASQAILPFTVLLSIIVLRRKYTFTQVAAVIMVVTGAVVANLPEFIVLIWGSNAALQPHKIDPLERLLFGGVTVISTLPSALSFILKEKIFLKYYKKNNSNLDILIVNAHNSLFQLIFVPFLLPLTVLIGETGGQPILEYVSDGFSCLRGITPLRSDPIDQGGGCDSYGCCTYAPIAYFAYICVNIVFNLSLLLLLRMGSTVLTFVCLKAMMPLSVLLFCVVKWPLLSDIDVHVSAFTIASLGVILSGIISYKFASTAKERSSRDVFNGREPPCCYPINEFFFSTPLELVESQPYEGPDVHTCTHTHIHRPHVYTHTGEVAPST
eukprot:GHVR01041462.1.p1 GENE.GHVR01041462.1~~GHVR01041462.1.p1  ORF type:complete len:393 (-),score=80.52 GHVR01041462.1:102-1280(-)